MHSRLMRRSPVYFALTTIVGIGVIVWILASRQLSEQRANKRDGEFVRSLAKHTSEAPRNPRHIKAAVFQIGPGDNERNERLSAVLDSIPTLRWEFIGPIDVRGAGLEQFDAVIFPGGSGKRQSVALEKQGRQAVKEFVRGGGGYVGICGGAFLATAAYDWSLRIINAQTMTGDVDVPGTGLVSRAAQSRNRGDGAKQMGQRTIWPSRQVERAIQWRPDSVAFR